MAVEQISYDEICQMVILSGMKFTIQSHCQVPVTHGYHNGIIIRYNERARNIF